MLYQMAHVAAMKTDIEEKSTWRIRKQKQHQKIMAKIAYGENRGGNNQIMKISKNGEKSVKK